MCLTSLLLAAQKKLILGQMAQDHDGFEAAVVAYTMAGRPLQVRLALAAASGLRSQGQVLEECATKRALNTCPLDS